MGCSCKNKQNQTSSSQQVNKPQTTETQTTTIQESIKKVIDKYYTKK